LGFNGLTAIDGSLAASFMILLPLTSIFTWTLLYEIGCFSDLIAGIDVGLFNCCVEE
jgi:hypothetical protein